MVCTQVQVTPTHTFSSALDTHTLEVPTVLFICRANHLIFVLWN